MINNTNPSKTKNGSRYYGIVWNSCSTTVTRRVTGKLQRHVMWNEFVLESHAKQMGIKMNWTSFLRETVAEMLFLILQRKTKKKYVKYVTLIL